MGHPLKTILCLGVDELNQGGWRDPEVCKKYPGSGYLPFLASNPDIDAIGEGVDYSDNTLVVQEELAPCGIAMVNTGAIGAVLMCMEAPLYAPLFYDQVKDLKKKFRYQLLFQGGTETLYFPSFDPKDLKEPEPWDKRIQKMVMVMSNKHWKMCEGIPGWKESPSWQKAVQAQLQDQRFLAIHTLQKESLLDLYGNGWPLGMRAPSIPAGEKVNVMRKYACGLCIENMAMPGYVTEKIIDCIVAGVVPVYSGAPNVSWYIPRECYLDAEGFQWPNEETAMKIITAGQEFLKSPKGLKFSYQSFALRIAEILQACELSQIPR